MPRLARPVKVDRNSQSRPCAAHAAVSARVQGFLAFAAVNLPAGFPDNPLKDIKPIFDFPWLQQYGNDADGHPNKRRLLTVSEFFRYTEEQDIEFFNTLDSNQDGKVTVDDLKDLLRKNNLPQDYAHQFINRARGGRWWATSVTFQEFKSMIDDSESKMLRAFCTLDVDSKGSLDLAKIKASLHKLELPATDSNARAMLRALGKAEDASIAYGEFRRFAILMPREKLMSDIEPNLTWFESATCVPIGGTIEQGASTATVLLRAALAGGLSSGISTLMMHPLDTLKTRVQSIPGASVLSIAKDVPSMGRKALYRGIIPAGGGAFSSHGIRTCAYEAALIGMSSVGIPFMQAQPVASFVGTFVGTLVRIPCEVLKQQLQRGNHENVKVALQEIGKLDGSRGFFRGAGALMAREVPFYVAGMVLYEQYKRCFNGDYFGTSVRNLSNAETIAMGALAGASASFLTTPADVVKSRLMTAAAGSQTSTSQIIVELISKEGVWALFKGAVPRAIWIAPLGAMNFAGYELAKRAMNVESSTSAPEQKPDVAAEVRQASAAVTGARANAAVTGARANAKAAEARAADNATAATSATAGTDSGATPSSPQQAATLRPKDCLPAAPMPQAQPTGRESPDKLASGGVAAESEVAFEERGLASGESPLAHIMWQWPWQWAWPWEEGGAMPMQGSVSSQSTPECRCPCTCAASPQAGILSRQDQPDEIGTHTAVHVQADINGCGDSSKGWQEVRWKNGMVWPGLSSRTE